MRNKICNRIFYAILIVCMFSGCEKKLRNSGINIDFSNTKKVFVESKNVRIVCNTFPIFDWTREICDGVDEIELLLIQKNGSDLHNFKASVEDLINIRQSDLFIYGGGESDEWITGDLFSKKGRVLKFASMDFHFIMEDDEDEIDEHIWLSLRNAAFFTERISSELCKIVPERASDFEKNAFLYVKKLRDLDEKFSILFTGRAEKENVFIMCDRFPFAYFARDYGIKFYSAFHGCSAETEASFEKVAFLAEKLAGSANNFVFTLENNDKKLAKTVILNSGRKNIKIYELDSMQSVKNVKKENFFGGKNSSQTEKKFADGEIYSGGEVVSYLSIMEKNYQTIKTALNEVK